MRKIITIGREFGSGGRELGRRLAEELKIQYYDKEIITEIAKKTSFSEEYIEEMMNQNPYSMYPITVGRSFYPMLNPVLEMSHSIFTEQSQIIKEMVAKSDCVIVGRCADYILSEKNPFRIFVYADMENKIKRCRENEPNQENISKKDLKNNIKSIDKNRAKYYNYYTDQTWGDNLNYDLCINTTSLDIKEIAIGLAAFFK